MKEIEINGRVIGAGKPIYIIAELSANHDQDLDKAIKTIEAIKETGADAVKIQTYTADTLTIDSRRDEFMLTDGLWAGHSLYELYQKAYTPWDWTEKLQQVSHDLGLDFFSSPFDQAAVDLLESLHVPAYKIASFEITDVGLISSVARLGKPVIISTGVATREDIELAVRTCKEAGNTDIILLKCTSAYPTPMNHVNLAMIPELANEFDVVAGLSDHTLGITIPVAAVAMGACVIEKHFILDKNSDSVDKDFSLDPQEFKEMVDAVRDVEQALGTVTYRLSDKIMDSKNHFSRSLFVVEDMAEGEEFTQKNVRSIRPGVGLHPKFLPEVIGRKATRTIERGTPLVQDLYQ